VNGNTIPPGSLPLLSPIQNSFGTGLSNGFVTVLNSAGTALVFSSYLGGDENSVSGLGIDSAANIYLAGGGGGPFPIVNAVNGVYLPLVPIPKVGVRPGSQSFIQKISLLSGTSFSHPTTVDFRPDPLPVGQSATAPVLLANTAASGNIAISNIVITGDYSQTNDCPNTLLPATSCKFQVTFAPAAEGDRSGNITVTDTAPGSPHVISLIGTGLVPHVSLTPNPLAFTSQAVGTSSATQAVTLTNTGGAVLTISSITTTGDFSESNDCGSQIGPGSCHISLLFLPTALGNRTGVLSVVDSASGSPHTVNLNGTAVAPNLGLGVPIGGISTATVSAGSPATYMLSIGGNGIGGVAALSCTGFPKGATCSVPATENVNANVPATFTVSVTTTSRSLGMLRSPGLSRSTWLWAMATISLFVLPSVSASRRSMSRRIRSKAWFVPVALVLLFCSCGGGGGGSNSGANPNGTPVGTYNLTVSAVSGSNTQSSTLTLIVR